METAVRKKDTESETLFFYESDSTRIKRFVMIPKLLLTERKYQKLSLRCRLAYSFYLRRYNDTKYSDKEGPFIIFTDAELASCLDTNADYANEVKRQLRDAGLIEYSRSTRADRIRVLPLTKEETDDTFYTEADMQSWRFLRFPEKLLEEKYQLLDINVRLYYAMLFDMMCLSQANYFSDAEGRLYFQISLAEQAKRFGISKNTLTKYKSILQACHLLAEYRPFGQSIRYYLMKLSAFEDRADEFYNMTAEQKKAFLKKADDDFRRRYIRNEDETAVLLDEIKRYLKSEKITLKAAAQMYTDDTGKALSSASLKKYLNGSRKIRSEVLNYFTEMTKGTQNPRKMGTENTNFDNSESRKGTHNPNLPDSFPDDTNSDSHLTGTENPNNSQPITYTDKNNTEKEKLISNHTGQAGSSNLSLSLDKTVSYMRHHFSIISDDDISLLQECLCRQYEQYITVSDDGQKVKVPSYEMADMISRRVFSDRKIELRIIRILNDYRRSGASASPGRTVRYMQTAFFSLIYIMDRHPVIAKRYAPTLMEADIYIASRSEDRSDAFSEEAKNYDLFGNREKNKKDRNG